MNISFSIYTTTELKNIYLELQEELLQRALSDRLNDEIVATVSEKVFPGDSLPYPKKTLEELNNELDFMCNVKNMMKNMQNHYC